MSAVEAGRLGATVTMDTVRQSPAYQADVEAARAELKAARADPALVPDAASCATEAGLVAQSVLVGVKP
jgi:acid phosphatase (class A)